MDPRRWGGVAVLGLVVATWPSLGSTQSLPFRTFSSDDGLAQSVVMAMAQERTGHLWFGTADGVSRFDGLRFENFGPADGLPHHVIRVIRQDSSGAVWVGTDGGLARWAGSRWDIPFPELAGESVRCLAETDDGVLWAGTYGRGLARIEDGALKWVTGEGVLVHDRVRALLVDRQGRMWVGTFGGGVSVSLGPRRDRFEPVPGLGDPYVRDLLQRVDGTVLAATNDGVFRWSDGVFERLDVGGDVGDTMVTSLLEDSSGRLWIGTRDLGACRLEAGALSCYDVDDGLADSSLTGLLEDREGNLWFATFGGGVSRLSSESFRNVTALEGLPFGGVQAFAEVDDELWMGTHGGGVARLRDERISLLTTEDGLPHPKVLALWHDGGGDVWVGTLDGAARWRSGRFERFTVADGLAHESVFAIARDRSGTLWFGTLGGLTGVSSEGIRTYRTTDGLPDDRVNTLLESRAGGLWIGTGNGVALLREGRIETPYEGDHGLIDGYVMDLHEDESGTLWVATADGLSRLENGGFVTLTREDGLSRNKCTAILEDGMGRLWVGTTRGIDIYDGTSFRSFTDRDGLPSSEVSIDAGYRDSAGRLWFGTVRGAVVFEPDAAPPEVPAPPVEIIGLEAGGEPLPPVDEVRLEAHRNSLRIEFVGISLTYPEDVVYEYRLVGVDRRPRRTLARFVEYASVPPGGYTFEVRAGLGEEVWGDAPASLRLIVTPPFWQAWWFRFVVGLGVAALMIATHLARVRSLRLRERRLEEEVRKRTAEVRRERLAVARKNQQLEVVNRIVQEINAELEFPSLLRTILDGVSQLERARCAVALVREGARNVFQVQASVGWPSSVPDGLSREDIEKGLLGGVRQVARGLWFGSDSLAGTGDRTTLVPRPCLVMTVDLDDEPAGYMIFGLPPDLGVEQLDLEVLGNLREHVVSAFLKGRILRELQQLNETKNEFLGVAAHDLRSPLGGIISYTGLLLRLLETGSIDPSRWRRFLGNVNTTAEQMLRMVNDLLDVASIESGRVQLQLEALPMAEILAEREALHLPAAMEKGIDLVVEAQPPDLVVLADRLRTGEILDNLISNALKFTHPGGRAEVRCEVRGRELCTHVVDSGLGLEPAEVEAAFSGRRLSARPTGGEPSTGLGLVIVRKLVEIQGGRVWASSEKGRGSTFGFSLPLSSD